MDARTHPGPRRIALMNQKGGVGKTTTTVNIAAAIAELGTPVLLVDLDPQAHASLHLGVDDSSEATSVYDILLDPTEIFDAPIEVKPNLWLLRSETDLAAAETELSQETDRYARLREALEAVEDRFGFVLLDCPPSLGLLTLNGLNAAQEVLIPMQAQFLALQGVGKLLETVQLVSQQLNPDLRVSGIVLCMFDGQTTHAQEVVADLEAYLESQRETETPWRGAKLYQPPIRRNIKLAECPSFGQTIFEYAPWAPGAADYRRIAEALLAEHGGAPSEPSKDDASAPAAVEAGIAPAEAQHAEPVEQAEADHPAPASDAGSPRADEREDGAGEDEPPTPEIRVMPAEHAARESDAERGA
ncbi:MAG: AAA family ATPase [Phycisphaerales bacterium]|nr:AAA family ATPase [Phycisphaerales bacterium]